MKNTVVLILTLLLPVFGAAQETENPAADPADNDLKEIILLAALQPDGEEFDNAWSAYVKDNQDGMDVAATIERVVKESRNLLRQTSAPGRGATKRSMSNDELRGKMQALADAAIQDSGH
jgi:hypothetical protein